MSALAGAFRSQASHCLALGSPFMARLFRMLAVEWPSGTKLDEKCKAFKGDIGPLGASLPLRIAGGLHALRLQNRAGLAEIYPPHDPSDAAFRAGILNALQTEDAFLTKWIDSPPQTNELRRSAILIPGVHLLRARFDLPFVLSELGASAGLNLLWDRFALQTSDWRLGPEDAIVTLTPDWTGPEPLQIAPTITERRGVDLRPQDPSKPDDLLRLTAYLWPDQPDRLANTRAAASADPAPVDAGDAIDWLAARLDTAPEGHLHLVQNTIAWQYFPKEAQAKGRALFAAAGAKASKTRPLAWLQLEADNDPGGQGGAAITLQIWPSGEIIPLGRADFHGRWVKWLGAPT
jgi:hypothetical protein